MPEFAQIMTSKNITNGSSPSSFPCDPKDQVYMFMEYLMKTCNTEHIPYSWLLQYMRLTKCKQDPCNPCKEVRSPKNKCEAKCETKCKPECKPKCKPECKPEPKSKCDTKCDTKAQPITPYTRANHRTQKTDSPAFQPHDFSSIGFNRGTTRLPVPQPHADAGPHRVSWPLVRHKIIREAAVQNSLIPLF